LRLLTWRTEGEASDGGGTEVKRKRGMTHRVMAQGCSCNMDGAKPRTPWCSRGGEAARPHPLAAALTDSPSTPNKYACFHSQNDRALAVEAHGTAVWHLTVAAQQRKQPSEAQRQGSSRGTTSKCEQHSGKLCPQATAACSGSSKARQHWSKKNILVWKQRGVQAKTNSNKKSIFEAQITYILLSVDSETRRVSVPTWKRRCSYPVSLFLSDRFVTHLLVCRVPLVSVVCRARQGRFVRSSLSLLPGERSFCTVSGRP
jgi:hypothetical protein